MLRKLNSLRAQSTAEYAIVFGLVIAAVIGMQTYVKRGWQARVRVESDQMSNAFASNPNWEDISTTSANFSEHYEPTKLMRSTHEQVDKDEETTRIQTGGRTEKEFEKRTQQQSGDYQKYEY